MRQDRTNKQNWYGFINGVARLNHAVSSRLAAEGWMGWRGRRASLTAISARLEDELQPVALSADFRARAKADLMRVYRSRNVNAVRVTPLKRLTTGSAAVRSWVTAALVTSLVGSLVAAVLTLSNRRRHAHLSS